MKRKVISHANLPHRLPIWPTLVTLLMLDRYNAPQWLYGAMGLLFLIVWALVFYGMATQEKIDIFEPKDLKEKIKDATSKWSERLEELQRKNQTP